MCFCVDSLIKRASLFVCLIVFPVRVKIGPEKSHTDDVALPRSVWRLSLVDTCAGKIQNQPIRDYIGHCSQSGVPASRTPTETKIGWRNRGSRNQDSTLFIYYKSIKEKIERKVLVISD